MAYDNRYKDFPDSSIIILPGDANKYNLYGVTIYGEPMFILFNNGNSINFKGLTSDDIAVFKNGVTIEGNISTVELSYGFAIGRLA